MRSSVILFALVACSPPPRTTTRTFDDLPEKFDDVALVVTGHLYKEDPAHAVGLGLHEYDGKLPDRSQKGLEQTIAQLRKDQQALLTVEVTTPREKAERDVLVTAVRTALFRLVDQDAYRTNPLAYTLAINLDDYIVRDYGPAVQRAQAVIDLCRALPDYLAQARTNLTAPMPKPWIAVALLRTKGFAEFADHDVRQQFGAITIPLANQAAIDPALETCKKALLEHAAWLEQQLPRGTDAFALGAPAFLKMLAETQDVTIDLGKLRAIADEDLRRNTKAIEDAAHAIAPNRPVREVVLEQAEDKPGVVLDTATEQVAAMRQFVIDHRIVTVPSNDVAEVRESPPFQRWNSAFLDGPGPFEQRSLPSFYYISPPDPKWPAAEQAAYIPPKADLLFTTIHEVWPGHFLQKLHRDKQPSKILRSFCTYSNSEGWAHYVEEMMFDAGAGGGTPQAHIGQLKEALLRNVRFVAALGLHTGAPGMTVDQAMALFQDKAFVDPGNARQQAARGTFDPMYLAYTLGKLMIRKLKADWLTKNPGATQLEFHDAFLSHGCAPVPQIRRIMLGDDSSPL